MGAETDRFTRWATRMADTSDTKQARSACGSPPTRYRSGMWMVESVVVWDEWGRMLGRMLTREPISEVPSVPHLLISVTDPDLES